MKYICINPFPNPPGNPLTFAEGHKPIAGAVVKNITSGKDELLHIHKGAQFMIGTATSFADLAPTEKVLVSQLMVSRKISEATEATVKKVDAEVAAEAKAAEAEAKRNSKADPMATLAGVLTGLQAAVEQLAEGQKVIAAALKK